MQKGEEKHGEAAISYYKKGAHPRWLLFSGTHGDEAGVIASVRAYLGAREKELPDFVWVPEVSPSAVRLGTRRNERGLDINRVFTMDTDEPEVTANRMIVDGKTFDLFVDFHEDPTTDAFYLYDSLDARGEKSFDAMYQEVQSLGVPLYRGVDDEELGLQVENGYVVCSNYDAAPEKGDVYTSWKYLKDRAIVKWRLLTVEVPGKASRETKDKIVALVFEYLRTL